jgi:hypothetical protein
MPTWVGSEASAPEPGSPWMAEEPELRLIKANPKRLPRSRRRGKALCPFCAQVVPDEQAVVRGPLIENDVRFDCRPVIAHRCKQAQGIIHLYVDQG